MAAGDSPTSISNLALAMLSEDAISNVDPPDNNQRGRLAAQFYDTSRRAVLAAHPWREAKRQVRLAPSATVPPFTYGAAYPLPHDFIRMFDMPEDGGMRWEIMNLDGVGLCILTNAGGPLDATYIFDLIDTTQMSALVIKVIAADMAANMALPLSRDASLQQSCMAQREAYLATARTVSAQQGSPPPFDADVLLRSRW